MTPTRLDPSEPSASADVPRPMRNKPPGRPAHTGRYGTREELDYHVMRHDRREDVSLSAAVIGRVVGVSEGVVHKIQTTLAFTDLDRLRAIAERVATGEGS